MAFFLEYLWLHGQPWVVEQVVDPSGGRGEEFAVLGIAGVITVTLILVIPLSLFRRRWSAAPFGVATALFGVVGVFIAVGFDDDLLGIPPLVISGLLADLLRQVRSDLAVGVAFGTLWTVVLAFVAFAGGGVGWPREIVGGALFFGITVAAAVASLVAWVDLVAVEDERMSALSITG